MSDEEDHKLSSKDKQKKHRKEQYQKAKERFKNSDYAKSMKERQKEMRKLAYQLAKERRKSKVLKESQPEPPKPPKPQGPPELTLIINPDFK